MGAAINWYVHTCTCDCNSFLCLYLPTYILRSVGVAGRSHRRSTVSLHYYMHYRYGDSKEKRPIGRTDGKCVLLTCIQIIYRYI